MLLGTSDFAEIASVWSIAQSLFNIGYTKRDGAKTDNALSLDWN